MEIEIIMDNKTAVCMAEIGRIKMISEGYKVENSEALADGHTQPYKSDAFFILASEIQDQINEMEGE